MCKIRLHCYPYGEGADKETLLGRGRVLEFLSVFGFLGRFPLGFGFVSYPPGPILKTVFLWRVFVDAAGSWADPTELEDAEV
jgi:hypothetical protein